MRALGVEQRAMLQGVGMGTWVTHHFECTWGRDFSEITLPETNSSHLKIVDWNMIFLLERLPCAMLVSGRVMLQISKIFCCFPECFWPNNNVSTTNAVAPWEGCFCGTFESFWGVFNLGFLHIFVVGDWTQKTSKDDDFFWKIWFDRIVSFRRDMGTPRRCPYIFPCCRKCSWSKFPEDSEVIEWSKPCLLSLYRRFYYVIPV